MTSVRAGTSLEIGSTGRQIASYGWSTAKSVKCEANVAFVFSNCTSANYGTYLTPSYDGSSGGYTSYYYTEPWYQAPVVPTSLSERNSPIYGSVPLRVDPDISLDADPATGFLIGLTETFPNGTVGAGEGRPATAAPASRPRSWPASSPTRISRPGWRRVS